MPRSTKRCPRTCSRRHAAAQLTDPWLRSSATEDQGVLLARSRDEDNWESQTDTELATSRLVAQAMTNRQIAGQLFICAHTVAFHRRQAFRKLGITSRVELAHIAVEHAREELPRRPVALRLIRALAVAFAATCSRW